MSYTFNLPYNADKAVPDGTALSDDTAVPASTAGTAGKRRQNGNNLDLFREDVASEPRKKPSRVLPAPRGLPRISKPSRLIAATAMPTVVPAAVAATSNAAPAATSHAVPAATSNAAPAATSNAAPDTTSHAVPADTSHAVPAATSNTIMELPDEGIGQIKRGKPIYLAPEYPEPTDELRKAVLQRKITGNKLVADLYNFRQQLEAYNDQASRRGSTKNQVMFGDVVRELFRLYKVGKKSRYEHSKSVSDVVNILKLSAGVSQAVEIVETPVTFFGYVTPWTKPEIKDFPLDFKDYEEKTVNELVKKYPGEAAKVGLKAGISQPILLPDATLGGTRSRSRTHKLSQRNKRKYTTCRNRKNHKNRKNRKN
jgi:hypothetical protein